jgi:hypothetical protein
VEWLTLISTAAGAIIALLGTFVASIFTSRDKRARQGRNDRRQSYLEFIAAVEATHSALRWVADPGRRHGDLLVETREAMGSNNLYGAREKIIVTADPEIVLAAERTIVMLTGVRDAVRAGVPLESIEYHNAYHIYAEAVWALRRAARRDLVGSTLAPEDVGKLSWDARQNCDFCQIYDAAHAPA